MKVWRTIASGFSQWIDLTATFTVVLLRRFVSPRSTIELVELDNDEFNLRVRQKHADEASVTERIRIANGRIVSTIAEPLAKRLRGSRVELFLKPRRFLFQPLELPKRATEFLDGIIRAQIDRLTPWNALDAAFGWSRPNEASGDRIAVTVAAAARASIASYVQAVADLGVQSIVVFTPSPDHETDAIKVMEGKPTRFADVGKIRHTLIMTLIAVAATTVVAVAGFAFTVISLDAQRDAISQRIAELRAAAGLPDDAISGSPTATRQKLIERKHAAPPTVVIIEALSRILPDHTCLTELRIEDNKIHVTGVTHDAASLIGLIEQSGLFSRATFFAPTTRSPHDPGERFHIEALIQPGMAAHS